MLVLGDFFRVDFSNISYGAFVLYGIRGNFFEFFWGFRCLDYYCFVLVDEEIEVYVKDWFGVV